jgi:hypothetical protein
MSDFTHSRRAQRGIARIQKAHSLDGEAIEAAFYAQRWLPGLQFLLIFGAIGDLIFVLVARPYWFAATPTRVLMFAAGRLYPKVGKQLLVVPVDTVRTEKLGGGPLRRRIKIRVLGGAEHQVSIHRAYWKELDRFNDLVGAHAG